MHEAGENTNASVICKDKNIPFPMFAPCDDIYLIKRRMADNF